MHRSIGLSLAFFVGLAGRVQAQGGGSVELETGPTRQVYNGARLPGDTGTRFSLRALIGTQPGSVVRVSVWKALDRNHSLRLLVAPLSISGDGTLATATTVKGQTFTGAVRAAYQFNSYRLTYTTTLRHTDKETLRVGGTLKVRDAKIELRQGATVAREYDLGFVPLAHASGERTLSPLWQLRWDIDGLAAPQGRAFDLGVRLAYRVDASSWLTAGGRMLEGGADNKQVYNFARFDTLTLGIARHW